MYSENGLQVDNHALAEVLGRADVLTIGFTLFPHRLLVDTRSTAQRPQFAGIVEPVGSVEERYVWLGEHRPGLGAPQAFSFFVWPHSVRSLQERDALAPLMARLAPETRGQLAAALDRANALERAAMVGAIRGDESWRTLWCAAN